MKLITALALAVATASVAMALASTTSADYLCTSNPGHSKECPVFKRLLSTERFVGLTVAGSPAVISTAGGEVKCDSEILSKGPVSEGANKGLKVLLEKQLFTECAGTCATVKAHAGPFWLLIEGATLVATLSGDNGINLNPGVLLEGCSLFGFENLNCLYQTGQTAVLEYREDFLIANISLTRSGDAAVCANTATLNAKYLITLDNLTHTEPLYLTSLP
jgi:hypothetical protein